MIVHFIVNSHLDPIWLWKREQGIDEVLSTARTACELLEDYPELHITRGEAWFYEIIENYAPALFERIRGHVAAGRWHIVGGWYVQPDCNLASPETYLKHGELSCRYFKQKFGVKVQTGYNVDSFGHNAMLPSFYNAAGIKNYIFMRPMKHEMTLPANDFIWRAPDGSEVLTSRILCSYATWNDATEGHLLAALEEANPKLGHVMCFIGVGDHGGGPFRNEIEYVLEHKNDYPGVEFRFSHPDAYFEAVRASKVKLPVVEGELQHHAIGCYAACSRMKQEMRKAENSLIRLGHFLPKEQLEAMWKKVLFATFHDSLAGSCIKSGYDDVYDSLGGVRDTAYEAFLKYSRQRNVKLPPKKRQRVIFDNTDAKPFNGFVTFQPSLIECWNYGWAPVAFYEANGKPHQSQMLPSEESTSGRYAFVIPAQIPGHGRRIFELDYTESAAPKGSVKIQKNSGLTNGLVSAGFAKSGMTSLKRGKTEFLASAPKVAVIPDLSDTWSHNMNSFPRKPTGYFKPQGDWTDTISGDLLSERAVITKDDDGNTLTWYCRMFDGIPGIQLKLRLNWHTPRTMAKLLIKPAFKVEKRVDGIPGNVLERKLNGEEYPIFNRMTLSGKSHSLSIVCENIFSVSVNPDGTVGLMLVRSPLYAHHDPSQPNAFAKNGVTDLGEHDYTVTLLADATEQEICDEVQRQSNPVLCSETTYGMTPRRF